MKTISNETNPWIKLVKIVGLVAGVIVIMSFLMSLVVLANYEYPQVMQSRFTTIDVERINIVEPDGTVKMVITNVDQFPNGNEEINGRVVNKTRKKRAGMLFYNEDGIESGGLIYDGRKKDDGHSAGLSLTYDQFDGDQVMQLLTTDQGKGDKRRVTSALMFNDRPAQETQLQTAAIMEELEQIEDRQLRRQKYQEYKDAGLLGGATRVLLGKTRSENNGLFLFGKDGSPRAMFYVDQNDQVKLEIFNEKGEVSSILPLMDMATATQQPQ